MGKVNARKDRRLPRWLTRRLPAPEETTRVRGVLTRLHLNTVCSGAHCPNRSECYASGTATFMILGEVCTRGCGFCAVATGEGQPVRDDEPQAVAQAADELGLRHVVITSVTRDDLPDGGAEHFARTIRAVRKRCPRARVEVLTPDFLGREEHVAMVIDAAPDVFNHNLETVRRLSEQIRPEADYARSLRVLACAARLAAGASHSVHIKSGLMVGLGECDEELVEAMRDLRSAGCDVLTVGQYLAPSKAHVPVARFVPPRRFDAYRDQAMAMGFRAVAAGPLVRSSYHAAEMHDEASGEG